MILIMAFFARAKFRHLVTRNRGNHFCKRVLKRKTHQFAIFPGKQKLKLPGVDHPFLHVAKVVIIKKII
jgi:hypothetical protein